MCSRWTMRSPREGRRARPPRGAQPARIAGLGLLASLVVAGVAGCGENDTGPKDTGAAPADALDDGGTSDATGAPQDTASAPASDAVSTDGEPADAGPAVERFTFAVITDTHVTGETLNLKRLDKAVSWINAHAEERHIELVLVLGDIGWGKTGLSWARGALDALTMPYVPVIGDNEIHGGAEQNFDEVFGPHFAKLAGTLPEFVHPPAAVTPAGGETMWLENVAFTYKGVRFIGLDISPRSDGAITGEQGELHDFPGGTWPWLAGQLGALGDRLDESVVLFSHIPMHLSPGGLSDVEMQQVYGLIGPLASLVYAHFGGHYHFELTDKNPKAGYVAFVTDATWDDALRVRLVTASSNAATFSYEHDLIDVPWP